MIIGPKLDRVNGPLNIVDQPISIEYKMLHASLFFANTIKCSSDREWLFDVLACVVCRWRGSWVNGSGWMEVGPRSYLHRWNALGF